MEINPGERELAGESAGLKSRQSWNVSEAKPRRSLVRRHDPGFEDANDGLPLARLCPNGRERILHATPLVRPVEDLPVPELPAASQTDGPCPDASQRERNHRQLSAGEYPGVLYCRARGSLSRRRSGLSRLLLFGLGRTSRSRPAERTGPYLEKITSFHLDPPLSMMHPFLHVSRFNFSSLI